MIRLRPQASAALSALLLYGSPAVAGIQAGPDEIAMPAVAGRAAYVSQIGHANVAQVGQSAANGFAAIRQEGERNEAGIEQSGNGTAHSEIRQTGDLNQAAVVQSGDGENVLYLTQSGTGNRAVGEQNAAGVLHNGAIMMQTGQDNEMSLVQDGSDNRAVLAQEGGANVMSAAQQGDGNRLVWSQQGTGLPNLGVSQSGGQAVQITQTGGQ